MLTQTWSVQFTTAYQFRFISINRHDPYAAQNETSQSKLDDEKAKTLLELARSQNVEGRTSANDDFAKKMFLGLKGGKKKRAGEETSVDGLSLDVRRRLEEDSSSSEEEFVEEDVREDDGSDGEAKSKKDRAGKRNSKKKKRKRRREYSSSEEESSESTRRRKHSKRKKSRKRGDRNDRREKRRERKSQKKDR